MSIKNKDIKWTEELIQNKLRLFFLSSSTKKYEMFGRYIYNWESDYLAITKSGYVYECEIKISRADYKNDSKKLNKHIILEGNNQKYNRPNYFYYAVPANLISIDEVPEQYGLIYVYEYGVDIVKPAPKLHSEKANFDKLKLIDKFYWGYINYFDKYRESDVDKYKKEIKSLEKQLMDYDDMLSEASGEIHSLKIQLEKLKNENKENNRLS